MGEPDIGAGVNRILQIHDRNSKIGIRRWVAATAIAAVLMLIRVPDVGAAPVGPELVIIVEPQTLVPGQAGYIYVGGRYPLDVRVELDGEPLRVLWTGYGYQALFAFGLDTPSGEHEIILSVHDLSTDERLIRRIVLTVRPSPYPNEEIQISERLVDLLDPEMDSAEVAYLLAVCEGGTPTLAWVWPYSLPVTSSADGGVISHFGGARTYNGGALFTHHTGTDLRRGLGETIVATADGVVVLTELLDIRGNVIVIDHGWGIYSVYAHLSQTYVSPGDRVVRGQIIGASGGTGRTQGPHLHFEIIVDGVQVDPLQWLALSPGFVAPRDLTLETVAGAELPTD